MKVAEHYHGKICVLEPKGDMMGGPENQIIHEKIKTLLAEGFKYLVVDLGKIKWMNSSGLGILMSVLTTVKEAEGELKIANATTKIENLLVITQLTKVFHNYNSVEKAVASYEL
jgi:anti-sigma B factor antagonist